MKLSNVVALALVLVVLALAQASYGAGEPEKAAATSPSPGTSTSPAPSAGAESTKKPKKKKAKDEEKQAKENKKGKDSKDSKDSKDDHKYCGVSVEQHDRGIWAGKFPFLAKFQVTTKSLIYREQSASLDDASAVKGARKVRSPMRPDSLSSMSDDLMADDLEDLEMASKKRKSAKKLAKESLANSLRMDIMKRRRAHGCIFKWARNELMILHQCQAVFVKPNVVITTSNCFFTKVSSRHQCTELFFGGLFDSRSYKIYIPMDAKFNVEFEDRIARITLNVTRRIMNATQGSEEEEEAVEEVKASSLRRGCNYSQGLASLKKSAKELSANLKKPRDEVSDSCGLMATACMPDKDSEELSKPFKPAMIVYHGWEKMASEDPLHLVHGRAMHQIQLASFITECPKQFDKRMVICAAAQAMYWPHEARDKKRTIPANKASIEELLKPTDEGVARRPRIPDSIPEGSPLVVQVKGKWHIIGLHSKDLVNLEVGNDKIFYFDRVQGKQ